MSTGSVNTGNQITVDLQARRTDITDPDDPNYREPVDSDGIPIRISSNPWYEKSNLPGDPDYIPPAENLGACPT